MAILLTYIILATDRVSSDYNAARWYETNLGSMYDTNEAHTVTSHRNAVNDGVAGVMFHVVWGYQHSACNERQDTHGVTRPTVPLLSVCSQGISFLGTPTAKLHHRKTV